MKMEYEIDTLTNASKNRAASRKLFQHFKQQTANRGLHSHQSHYFNYPLTATIPPVLADPEMLHRSPSGAQRKIRQRRDELSQQRQSSSSFQSQQSTSSETLIDLEYRSLVDSTSYRSILDDMSLSSYRTDVENTKMEETAVENKVLINTFSKPEPARRMLASLDSSHSSDSVTGSMESKYNPPITSSIIDPMLNSFNNAAHSDQSGKPTVEVHPMPVPRTSLISSHHLLPQKLSNIPPPIPKKPEKLRKKPEQEMTTSISPNENEVPRDKSSSIRTDSETSSENVVVIERKKNCNSQPCSSIEALDRLHTSNLVRSIEEKFDNARLSAADISELETRRILSIKKLISKVSERSADLDELKHEKEAALSTIQELLHNHPSLPRIEKEIKMRANLIQLDGVARARLQQISNLTKEQAHALQDRTDYWHYKIKDVRYLAIFVSQRIAEVEDNISSYLSKEDFDTYKKCMDLLIELEADNTAIDEKLTSVKKQIDQLQNIASFPGINKH